MHRLILSLLFGAATLTPLPAAAQSDPPLSYEWAKSASPEAAGQRLLGPVAALYPNYGGQTYSPFGLQWGVAFASTARSSGMRGICEVDVVRLQFGYHHGNDARSEFDDETASSAPSLLRSIDTETRYRAVADTAPKPWTEEYEAGMDAACASQTDGWEFGIADDRVDAWYAVRLQTILPDMAATEPQTVLALLKSCVGDECRSPLLLFSQLRRARFWYVDVEPCDALVDLFQWPRFRGPFCLKARYILSENRNEGEHLFVTVRFEQILDEQQELMDPRLLEVSLKRESIIFD